MYFGHLCHGNALNCHVVHLAIPGTRQLLIRKQNLAGCLALFFFLVSCDCCVAHPHDATDLSAVCDFSIS